MPQVGQICVVAFSGHIYFICSFYKYERTITSGVLKFIDIHIKPFFHFHGPKDFSERLLQTIHSHMYDAMALPIRVNRSSTALTILES